MIRAANQPRLVSTVDVREFQFGDSVFQMSDPIFLINVQAVNRIGEPLNVFTHFLFPNRWLARILFCRFFRYKLLIYRQPQGIRIYKVR